MFMSYRLFWQWPLGLPLLAVHALPADLISYFMYALVKNHRKDV